MSAGGEAIRFLFATRQKRDRDKAPKVTIHDQHLPTELMCSLTTESDFSCGRRKLYVYEHVATKTKLSNVAQFAKLVSNGVGAFFFGKRSDQGGGGSRAAEAQQGEDATHSKAPAPPPGASRYVTMLNCKYFLTRRAGEEASEGYSQKERRRMTLARQVGT
ncbi:unnamed protein product [Amoebophrya sp. A25]|nr:unnamed protein product [Amoebophrya sp. A25]|eukprot:GSA25T00023268001.1